MKITRKRELIIECERSVTIKFGTASIERFCRRCADKGHFITVEEAAILRQTTAREIFRLIETNKIHFDEGADSLLIVCLASLWSPLKISDEA